MAFGRDIELGFANYKEKENPFTSISRFGGSSNNPPANTTGNVAGIPSGLFGMPTTDYPTTTTTTSSPPLATQSPSDFSFGPCRDTHPPMPLFSSIFHNPSNPFSCGSSSNSNGGSPFSSTTRFGFSTASSTGDQLCVTNPSTAMCPFSFGAPSPFSAQLFSSGSSATTSPVGSELSFRGFLGGSTSPVRSELSFRGFSGSSATGPFTKSFVQENNTSSNNVSVFAPFTRSNPRVSDIQGTRVCSYAPTPAAENFGNNEGNLCSVSAMPMYKEKSHEELRLEDYQLSSTGAIRGFGFTNTSSSNPFSLGPSVSTTCTSRIPTSSLPVSSLGISDVQGTRICSYAPTSLVEYGYGELNSISAMPCYEKKSHEELRLEDYQLPSHISTSSSSTTGAIPSFSISNKSSTDSLPLGPSVSTTCTSPIATSLLPLHRPVISVPLSIEIRHLGDLLATTQITIPVPTCGTDPASNCATVTDAIITSIPELVSTGGFRWPPDNRQTPVKPVATEARATVPNGISGLPDSENGESAPAIEKYKPDDEDAVKYRKILDVMAMVPKLKCPDYYTVPSMDDLITNELKRPGFCSQVKDFEIGKHGYGSIKFLGETDVRNLDLESMVRFNTREVIFCMDKKEKPPIGQGLNKAAEITLNVHCIDNNTGKQYIDGPKVDKYKQLLVRKTMEQGAEFVSFDPVKGEWKFKVQHF